jgi:hypothetical protein
MVTLRTGQVFIGYVLSSGTWVAILSEDTRRIHYYRAENVARLHICQIQPTTLRPPLIALFPAGLNAPAHTPLCFEAPAPGLTPTARRPPSLHPVGAHPSRRNPGAS